MNIWILQKEKNDAVFYEQIKICQKFAKNWENFHKLPKQKMKNAKEMPKIAKFAQNNFPYCKLNIKGKIYETTFQVRPLLYFWLHAQIWEMLLYTVTY